MTNHFTQTTPIHRRPTPEITQLYNALIDKRSRIQASDLYEDGKLGIIAGIDMCLDEIAVRWMEWVTMEHKKI